MVKKVRLKICTKGVVGQILDRAGDGIGAVVKQRVERAASGCQTRFNRRGDAGFILIIQNETGQALGLQTLAIFLLATGCIHLPAAFVHRVRRVITDAR